MTMGRTTARGRRWLKRSKADLLIWGRARKIDDQAAIYFMFPSDGNVSTKTEKHIPIPAKAEVGSNWSIPTGTKIYDFARSPQEFGNDAAVAIALAALNCIRPVFQADHVRRLKTEYARAIVQKLEPFVDKTGARIPENLYVEIRDAYLSASRGLGRLGAMDGWENAFRVQREELSQYDKEVDSQEWMGAAIALARMQVEAGEQFGHKELVDSAVSGYQEIIEIKSDAFLNGIARHDLAGLFLIMAEEETDNTKLELAITMYRNIILEWSRDRRPFEWAMAQNNLGCALEALGDRENSVVLLEQSVDAFGNALLEHTQSRAPDEWAMAQRNLGF
jgi:tetratricopeptide (TPR) repeat protein